MLLGHWFGLSVRGSRGRQTIEQVVKVTRSRSLRSVSKKRHVVTGGFSTAAPRTQLVDGGERIDPWARARARPWISNDDLVQCVLDAYPPIECWRHIWNRRHRETIPSRPARKSAPPCWSSCERHTSVDAADRGCSTCQVSTVTSAPAIGNREVASITVAASAC